MRALTPTVLATLIPAAATAHPDHTGSAVHGLAHHLSDPFHVATYGVCALAAVVLGSLVRRQRAVARKR
ncbi:MAG: hypothetical protein QNK05_14700 [Myxococcota bacterium]|nr:hypothetical protein [Myxococcota bacterium]